MTDEERRYFFREWRLHTGLTLLDVARILGITAGQVSKIETNKRDFTGDYLEDFSIIVGCGVADPLINMPENYKDRTGTLSVREKVVIKRRLQSRSKEIRKLRRNAVTNGKKPVDAEGDEVPDGTATL